MKDLAEVINYEVMQEFDSVVDKCQVTLVTMREKVEKILTEEVMPRFRAAWPAVTDESVDTFCSCILC